MFFFFFNDTATTEIYTLSLHDALPICAEGRQPLVWRALDARWIGKRPMQTLDPRGHDRAHLLGAQRHDRAHLIERDGGETLGALVRDVDPDFGKRRDRQRVKRSRLRPRAPEAVAA